MPVPVAAGAGVWSGPVVGSLVGSWVVFDEVDAVAVADVDRCACGTLEYETVAAAEA